MVVRAAGTVGEPCPERIASATRRPPAPAVYEPAWGSADSTRLATRTPAFDTQNGTR
jgi:hypothetical protein